MANTRSKTSYLTQVRLREFLSRNLPNVWLLTFTFQENILEKAEAMRRFKPIADYLSRHKVDWCGVWQQQRRGAWHLHVLVNRWQHVGTLRAFAVARGWGPFLNAEKVGAGGYRFTDPARAVSYLTRYLSREMCGHVPMRVRLAAGTRSSAVGTVRFSWVGGWSKVWRVGAGLYAAAHGVIPRTLRQINEAIDYAVHEMRLYDFEPIDDGPNPYEATPLAI